MTHQITRSQAIAMITTNITTMPDEEIGELLSCNPAWLADDENGEYEVFPDLAHTREKDQCVGDNNDSNNSYDGPSGTYDGPSDTYLDYVERNEQ